MYRKSVMAKVQWRWIMVTSSFSESLWLRFNCLLTSNHQYARSAFISPTLLLARGQGDS
nr:MAG TPA: hypothetical protein [Herelleviridae sp.]